MWKDDLKDVDPEVFGLEENETMRINEGLELIPSENFPSRSVLHMLGSVFNNKYAEGYPAKRYYGGNVYIDKIEFLAIERAKELFGCEHVNVQPLSGSPANIAVYFALMEFGDKLMGMNLAQGGHLTHGHKVNFSGKSYNVVQYGVDPKTHRIDYDEVRKLAKKEKPKIIVSGATAYPREFDFKAFHEISEESGAVSMADIAHIAGLIVGGVHQSPFPFTDIVTTTTHKTLRGPRGGMIMCKERYAKDIDRAVFPGLQGGPHEHTIASVAVALKEAMQPEFKEYAKQIVKNAKTLAGSLMDHGFTLISGGTDNHLILVDLRNKNVTGSEGETALDRAGITVNKNMIPYDPRTPFDPSGIRLGTPAITTRGMKESEMQQVGELISKAIDNFKNEGELKRIREEVLELCKSFPVY
ncbi:MAG: serine hydroxymethyltransferase [Candidatus Aenigmatarchaeota archaeon]|nr:MAG: serine hydroxymethyltransferase [Candidatus Aenigmarchaeota archaeon]